MRVCQGYRGCCGAYQELRAITTEEEEEEEEEEEHFPAAFYGGRPLGEETVDDRGGAAN